MKNINLPPFYLGQRIVALENVYLWKKGDEFVVLGIKKSCCYWIIDIGITLPTVYTYFQCQICRRRENIKPRQVYWPMANCFAPIEENFEVVAYKEVIRKEKLITCAN